MISAINSRLLGFAKGAAKSLKAARATKSGFLNTTSECLATAKTATQQTPTHTTSVFGPLIRHFWSSLVSQRTYMVNNVARQFITRNAPRFQLLAFAGFCLSDGDKHPEEKASIGNLYEYVVSNMDQFWKQEGCDDVFPDEFSEYDIGQRLGSPSSNAAVYSASYNGTEVALKIMFNYSVPSNATAISEAFKREYSVLPTAQTPSCNQQREEEEVILPEHPFIIKLHGKFVDKTPLLPDAIDTYPIAVPKSLHAGGHGRNKTMCLVMPKYACSLREYLATHTPSSEQCLSIFLQLLEGVAHLELNGIAHRDLKSDNVLIKTSGDGGDVQVAITDFGCCLAEEDMLLPFATRHTDRGGNFALLAPEIATAVPQQGYYLDYSTADAWTCGTLAYEIFKRENPFYSCLSNVEYCDEDLKAVPINSEWKVIDHIVSRLLTREPEGRLSACSAATIISLFINAPHEWLLFPKLIHRDTVETWLLAFSLLTLDKCRWYGDTRFLPPHVLLDLVFLHRTTPDHILDCLSIIHELKCQEEDLMQQIYFKQ